MPVPTTSAEQQAEQQEARESILPASSRQSSTGAAAATGVTWKGWLALAVFTLQNSTSALYGQFVLQQRPRCNPRVMVMLQEAAIKLPTSVLLYWIECGGVLRGTRSLVTDVRERPRTWALMFFPAVCYTVGAVLQMVGASNLEASTGAVTFQSKILFTASCSVALLGTRLSRTQLVALLVLSCGVVLANTGTATASGLGGGGGGGGGKRNRLHVMNPELGVAAWLGAALCSAFASVYFEKTVKMRPEGESQPSLWLRNIQMSLASCAFGAVLVALDPDPHLPQRGLLYNFDEHVWAFVIWGGLGGMVIALVIKHADNILRGFAAGLALILTSVGSRVLFEFVFTAQFVVGAAMVAFSIFLYSYNGKLHERLLDSWLCCAGGGGRGGAASVLPSSPTAALCSPKGGAAASEPLLSS